MNITVMGISGTPIKGGNCDRLVQEALKGAAEIEGVETTFVTLADKEIAMCNHCQYCIDNRTICKIDDDAYRVFDMMEKADGIILGGPTWSLTISPPLLHLFSRDRYIKFFTHTLRNKVAGFVTLGWFGVGMEKALEAMEGLVYFHGMIPVAKASAIASTAAFGQRAAHLEHGVLDNTYGIKLARNVGRRVVEVARMIRYATEAGVVLAEAPLVTGGTFKVRDKEK